LFLAEVFNTHRTYQNHSGPNRNQQRPTKKFLFELLRKSYIPNQTNLFCGTRILPLDPFQKFASARVRSGFPEIHSTRCESSSAFVTSRLTLLPFILFFLDTNKRRLSSDVQEQRVSRRAENSLLPELTLLNTDASRRILRSSSRPISDALKIINLFLRQM
jgi:hypothetical protein